MTNIIAVKRCRSRRGSNVAAHLLWGDVIASFTVGRRDHRHACRFRVAAAAVRGVRTAMGHVFGSGLQGLYPVYADAFRQAARAVRILPHEMQSVAWEGAKGLFSDRMKSGTKGKTFLSDINKLWGRFRRVKASIDEPR